MTDDFKILTKPTEQEMFMLNAVLTNDHLRDVCRIFKEHISGAANDDHAPTLLDVGARNSKLIPFFANLGFHYFGVDINPQGSSLMRGSMEKLPFNDESFDIVFCSHTLEHSENIIQALKEMKRVLRSSGTLFIATPYHCHYQIFECDKTHLLVPTKEQMTRLFQYLGIVPFKIEYVNVEGQEERFANLISIGRVFT